MNPIIFWSDPHIGHKNIVGPEVSNWDSGYRHFKSVEQHDKIILDNFNMVSSPDTIVYCLGDLTFKGQEAVKEILDYIEFKEFHWILGNHDSWAKKKFKAGNKSLHVINHPNVFLYDYLEIKVQDQATNNHVKFILFHYPIGSWNQMYKGSIHLHGHSHGTYPDKGKMLDVGVDSAYNKFGEYVPFEAQEIIDYMRNEKIVFTDHHNENTN